VAAQSLALRPDGVQAAVWVGDEFPPEAVDEHLVMV
jgi:hypothetical protein